MGAVQCVVAQCACDSNNHLLTTHAQLYNKVPGKTTESDRHPNPNPSLFCMKLKQTSVLLVAVRYGSLLKLNLTPTIILVQH